MKISPTLPAPFQTSTSAGIQSLRFTYYWRSSAAGVIHVSGPCGLEASAEAPGMGLSTPAFVEVSLPATNGAYLISTGTNPPVPPNFGGEGYLVFDKNGAVLSFGDSGPFGTRMGVVPPFIWSVITGFEVRMVFPSINVGGKNYFSIDPVIEDCQGEEFSFEAAGKMEIVGGADFGQFYKIVVIQEPNEEEGTPAQVAYEPKGAVAELGYMDEIYEYVFIADGIQPESGEETVTIELSSQGKSSQESFIVKKSGFEILLGESKYYQAKPDPNNVLNLIIEELQQPVLDGGIPDDVWGPNPVTAIAGEKVGVYYEKLKPLVGPGFVGNEQLPRGLIRLVGRYWGGTPYKVRLTANGQGRSGSVDIEVTRPARLLSQDQSPDYEKSSYITGEEISIDEICIQYGGELGIPPQFLKGQMFQESYKGRTGRLWPSYRYEPFFDLRSRNGIFATDYMTQPFWVDETGMNPDNVPSSTEHQNVHPIHYPRVPATIGEYFAEHRSEYIPGMGRTQRLVGGQRLLNEVMLPMVFDWYVDTYTLSESQAADSTREWLLRYLRTAYPGWTTEWAQTRMAASYGYSQMLYTTAIVSYVGFPRKTKIPEDLSDYRVLLPLVCKFIKRNVDEASKKYSFGDSFSNATWKTGMERLYFYAFREYNGEPQYVADIIPNGYRFLPR